MLELLEKFKSLRHQNWLPFVVDIIGIAITGSTWSDDFATVPFSQEGWSTKQYYDGLVTALAITGNTSAAFDVTMYCEDHHDLTLASQ